MNPSVWDFSNGMLYALCRNNPRHTDTDIVLAKILLIGRAYAAAIDRRKPEGKKVDGFYTNTVAPAIRRSNMDAWIDEARSVKPHTSLGMATLVKVHSLITDLFHKISGMDKRSLASKYLHFHVPKLVYIFDSRAVQAIRDFSEVLPRASRSTGLGDNEYRKFAEKCEHLRQHCIARSGLRLSPRQLDNLLLKVNEP